MKGLSKVLFMGFLGALASVLGFASQESPLFSDDNPFAGETSETWADDGWTDFYDAAARGNTKLVKALFHQQKIDINKRDTLGRTCLQHAAARGRLEVTHFLLSQDGIDLNAQNDRGATVLHFAAGHGVTNIVRRLLEEQNIKVNVRDQNGETPLMMAVCNGHLEIVKLLLNRKDIQVNKPNLKGWMPLHFAAKDGSTEIVKSLLSRKEIEVHTSLPGTRITPLVLAVFWGRKNVVSVLLNYMYSFRQPNKESILPTVTNLYCLHVLARQREREAVFAGRRCDRFSDIRKMLLGFLKHVTSSSALEQSYTFSH